MTGDKPQDKPQDKPEDINSEMTSKETSEEKSVQEVEEPKEEEKTRPVANASSTQEEGPAKKSARRKRTRSKKKTANLTAPALSAPAGGEIKLELRGLKIEAVDEEKGLIIVSPKATAPTPPSKPKDSSLEGLAPGTEVKGTVVSIFKAKVFCDIGQTRLATLKITADMAEKLCCRDELALVVEKMDKEWNNAIVAMTPAAEQEVAGRTPNRKSLADFEVGMEVEGYVQNVGSAVFVDVHGPRNVYVPWPEVPRSSSKRPQVGDHVHLKLLGIEVETGKMNATILT